MAPMKHSTLIAKYLLIALFCSWISADTAGEALHNLLKNSDFSTLNAAGQPEFWTGATKAQTIRVTPPDESAGKRALAIKVLQSEKNLGQFYQSVAVNPGKRYQLYGKIKASVKGMATIQIKRYKKGKEVDRFSTPSNKDSDWQSIDRRFESMDADHVQILCRFRQTKEQIGQEAWFADLGLEELGELLYVGDEVPPRVVTTFNSAGIYWKPAGGGPERSCKVRYRKKGSEEWHEALDLWCDPNEHTGAEENSLEYRGSIVHLEPGKTYDAELSIAEAGLKRAIEFTTLSEDFPITRRVALPVENEKLYEINEGGSAESGYVLYEAPEEAHWKAEDETDVQIRVNASWVIIRGLKLTGAKVHGIQLMDVNHVVIEDCDISGWGRIDPRDGFGINLDSALYSQSRQLETIVIQDCRLHHPRSNSNSWREKTYTGNQHPRGPQGISFQQGKGHYIIRRNRIYSDPEHMFNDAMGETRNFSYSGFPNRDSDIYDNFVSHCWDDGLEIEGADMNVRVWNNYIDYTWGAVGAASPSLGPVYFWRNVYGVSRAGPAKDEDGYRGHYLIKLGNENLEWVRGKMFIFHNTALQPPPYEGRKYTCGAESGIVFTSTKKQAHNITSRNNILHTRNERGLAIRDAKNTANNDFDYDMFNGTIHAKDGSESHGIKGEPVYESAADGRLWLAPGTPGHDAALPIPNFNDNFIGKAPDIGAVETGSTEPKPATWPKFPQADQ